jgi:hypothetical protein
MNAVSLMTLAEAAAAAAVKAETGESANVTVKLEKLEPPAAPAPRKRSIFVFVANKTSIVAGNYIDRLCALIDKRLNASKEKPMWRAAVVSLFNPVYSLLTPLVGQVPDAVNMRQQLFHIKMCEPTKSSSVSECKFATHMILLAEVITAGYSNTFLVDTFVGSVARAEGEIEHIENAGEGGGDCYVVCDVRTPEQLSQLRARFPDSIAVCFPQRTTKQIDNDSIATSMFETAFQAAEIKRAAFDECVTAAIYNETQAAEILNPIVDRVVKLAQRAQHQ